MHNAGCAPRSHVALTLVDGWRQLLALPRGLRRLLARGTSPGGTHRIPDELAHLDDRLLRDIGIDPGTAARETAADPFSSTRWP